MGALMPAKFEDLHNLYLVWGPRKALTIGSRKALIIGCGVSAQRLHVPLKVISIGIHDCWSKISDTSLGLDYLMVYDKKCKFLPGRQDTMRDTPASRVIIRDRQSARSWLGVFPEERVVWVPHKQGWRTEAATPQCMWYGKTSIDPAMHFAEYIGCRDIGIIGADFQNHHWENNTKFLDEKFKEHADAMAQRGCRVVNLSQKSLLTCFPTMLLREWLDDEWRPNDGQ